VQPPRLGLQDSGVAEGVGLAAGLLNTSLQLGAALGLAILPALATARTHHLLNTGATPDVPAALPL